MIPLPEIDACRAHTDLFRNFGSRQATLDPASLRKLANFGLRGNLPILISLRERPYSGVLAAWQASLDKSPKRISQCVSVSLPIQETTYGLPPMWENSSNGVRSPNDLLNGPALALPREQQRQLPSEPCLSMHYERVSNASTVGAISATLIVVLAIAQSRGRLHRPMPPSFLLTIWRTMAVA